MSKRELKRYIDDLNAKYEACWFLKDRANEGSMYWINYNFNSINKYSLNWHIDRIRWLLKAMYDVVVNLYEYKKYNYLKSYNEFINACNDLLIKI